MPSGAKKRKAAKKKKENQLPNSSSGASTHNHDGDDVKHQDDKESDDVGEVSSPASQDHHSHQNFLTEGTEEGNNKGEDNVPVGEGTAVQVEREFKIEDESDKKNGGSSRSSSSSSSSSSDDESHDIKISQDVVDVPPAVESVKAPEPLSGETFEAIPSAQIEGSIKSVVENRPVEKIETGIHINAPGDSSAASSDAVEFLSNENGDKKLSVVEGQAATSYEGEKFQYVEKTGEALEPKEGLAPKDDDGLSLSYSAPGATTDNGAEQEKESGVTQPLLAPAPRPAQASSWKCCCGLFELFTGSDR